MRVKERWGRVVWPGLEEADYSCSLGRRGVVNRSQTWLSDLSKIRRGLSKPGYFLAYVVVGSHRARVNIIGLVVMPQDAKCAAQPTLLCPDSGQGPPSMPTTPTCPRERSTYLHLPCVTTSSPFTGLPNSQSPCHSLVLLTSAPRPCSQLEVLMKHSRCT